MGPDLGLPDWRDGLAYGGLERAEPDAFAWEWLRRDPGYRAAAAGAQGRWQRHVSLGTAEARIWGLHAFEDPDLPASRARPVWHGSWLDRVLPVSAEAPGGSADQFDLERVRALAKLVQDDGGERLLLSDGASSLRIDIIEGSVLTGPVRLVYRLSGFAAVEGPLLTLRGLLRLWHGGRLEPPPARSRNRRLILLLRTWDATRAGATQREIAASLLSRAPLPSRWRSEAPSVRSQAQRLVRGAGEVARGGWRQFLRL